MIIRIAPIEHHWWMKERLQTEQSTAFIAIEAVDETGKIHGMVGYDGWAPNSVVMTIALDNPACLRGLLAYMFDFAFNVVGKGIALAMVRGRNQRSLKLCAHVGFREGYRLKDGVAVGEDYVIMEMRREECRWISSRKAA